MNEKLTRIENVVIGRIMIVSVLKEIRSVWIDLRWNGRKAQDKYEIGQDSLRDSRLELNEFETVVEAGSNGLNLFFSGKVGLLLGDSLYSGT